MVFTIGAFFCYGMYTIQRNGFLLDGLQKLWLKFPKQIHEPLYSCGVCVSSIWGCVYLISTFLIGKHIPIEYQLLANIPLYIISFGGVCALVDRAVKFFEYGYRYTQIKPLSNYSYLENYEFRDTMIQCFLNELIEKQVQIIEIGGRTQSLIGYEKYVSFEKMEGSDIINSYIGSEYFILIKGLAFEGNFNYLLNLLSNSNGFIIESSLGGDSGKQLNWILDEHKKVIRIPYMTNDSCDSPTHCGGNINNRIVVIKKAV